MATKISGQLLVEVDPLLSIGSTLFCPACRRFILIWGQEKRCKLVDFRPVFALHFLLLTWNIDDEVRWNFGEVRKSRTQRQRAGSLKFKCQISDFEVICGEMRNVCR